MQPGWLPVPHQEPWWHDSLQDDHRRWLPSSNSHVGWDCAWQGAQPQRQNATQMDQRCVAWKVSNVLGTSSGAIAVRSIRRLRKEAQISQELVSGMKGIPWQPRDGVRHKITRELSQPVALPAPAAAGNPALQDEMPEEERPTLAEDGLKVDHDGLVVQAAAQLEEELGEDDDAEDLPAGYPADVSPVPTTPATTPASSEHGSAGAASPPPPSRSNGQPPPFRGAGWSSALQNLPDEPMSPSGLGQGGKRVRDDPFWSGKIVAQLKESMFTCDHLCRVVRDFFQLAGHTPSKWKELVQGLL